MRRQLQPLRASLIGLSVLLGGACAQEPVDASTPRFLADEVSSAGAVALANQSGAARPPCLETGDQVVALGDSYVASPLLLVSKIQHLAKADGALSWWDRYRDYAVGGSTLGQPAAWGGIPPQWLQAKADDDEIHVVIMDGGGNDLLDSGCLVDGASAKPSCLNVVHGVLGVAQEGLGDMQANGVRDVVYFLYPHLPIGGADIIDYLVEQMSGLCAAMTTDSFRCHLVDTREAFAGHAEYFDSDPIHANRSGALQIAQLVYQTMKTACIAQPASSGCCEPAPNANQ